MKIAVLMKIARQVEGEYVFLNVIQAHVDPDQLHKYLRKNNLPKTEEIQGIPCVIEYGVIEDIEVEGLAE